MKKQDFKDQLAKIDEHRRRNPGSRTSFVLKNEPLESDNAMLQFLERERQKLLSQESREVQEIELRVEKEKSEFRR